MTTPGMVDCGGDGMVTAGEGDRTRQYYGRGKVNVGGRIGREGFL
jgi:hypothetical protein